ncbi:MAG: hypothetical protein DDT18_01667 [Actinobacteria bacterium]|nr:hypothetical protein [Actinomycetota bacterium]
MRHLSPNKGGFFGQIDLEAGISQIQRGLHPGYATTYYQHRPGFFIPLRQLGVFHLTKVPDCPIITEIHSSCLENKNLSPPSDLSGDSKREGHFYV